MFVCLALLGCGGSDFATYSQRFYRIDGSPTNYTILDQDLNYCYRKYASNSTNIINMSQAEFDVICMRRLGWGFK